MLCAELGTPFPLGARRVHEMRVVPLVGDVRGVANVALERGRTTAAPAAAAAAVGALAVVAAHALQDAAVDRLRLLCRRAGRRVVLLVRDGGGAASGQGLQDDRVSASGSGASKEQCRIMHGT